MEKTPQLNNQEKTISKFNSPQEELDFLKVKSKEKKKKFKRTS